MKKLICAISILIALAIGCAGAESAFWSDSAVNETGMEDTQYRFSAACWAAQGDTVYFYDIAALGGEKLLYRIDTSGVNPVDARSVILPDTGDPAIDMRCLMPLGDSLLFVSQCNLYLLDMPTGTVTEIYPGVECAWYADGWAYVFHQDFGMAIWSRTDGIISQQTVDMSEYTDLTYDYNKTFDYSTLIVHDGYAYIAGNKRDPLYPGKIFKVALDGSGVEMLFDEYALAQACGSGWISVFDVNSLFVHEGQLYIFMNGNIDRGVYIAMRCELDGSNPVLLSAEYPWGPIGYTDGWFLASDGAYDLTGLGSAEYPDWSSMRYPIGDTNLRIGETSYSASAEWYNGGYQYCACIPTDGSAWLLYRSALDGSGGEVLYSPTGVAETDAVVLVGWFEDLAGDKVYFYSDGTCLLDYGTYQETSTYMINSDGNYQYVEFPNEPYSAICIIRPDQIMK